MTVKELREQLEYADPEMEVKLAYNYGDYWNTIVAANVRVVEESEVTWSEYHSMDKVVIENYEEDEEEKGKEDTKPAIIISAVSLY